MKIKLFGLLLSISLVFGCEITDILTDSGLGGPTETEVIMGLKEALQIGTIKGVDVVGQADGYFKNAVIKILMPEGAQSVVNTLRDLGLGNLVDQAVLSINRAAEDAASAAKPIFVNAIKQMTIADAWTILRGDDNAATNYFKSKTSQQLYNAFKPKIETSLDKVGATRHYGDVMETYNQIPFVQPVNTDLSDHVTNKAIDGLFHMIEQEEKNIRTNISARVTDLLRKVFGAQD